jgi:hypothetical protein
VRGIPPAGVVDRMLASGAPEAGARVMATGIVSVALALDGQKLLSRILLVVAAAMWLLLAVAISARAVRDAARLRAESRTPAALSWVAGTAVLGTRFVLLGWTGVSAVLLGGAVGLWVLLIGPVLTHWRTPTVGASLLLAVATESLAALAADLAVRAQAAWLETAALVPFALGLGAYGFVMFRFDRSQLGVGRGDHWITGGALAISALAAGNLAAGAGSLGVFGHGHGALEVLAVGLWIASMVWLPALVLAEVLHPRLYYDVRRWSTVFPVGMYAACSFVVGAVAQAGAITDFARLWVWVAVGVWALVCAAMIASKSVRTRTD